VKLTIPSLSKGYPAYGNMPVLAFWRARRELREFWTEERSLVLTKILGNDTDISPGQTSRSRFAPSVTQLLPSVIVALLYHVSVCGSEMFMVLFITPRCTKALP
jgi:hypothetical protein